MRVFPELSVYRDEDAPRKDTSVSPPAKSTDASTLHFPLPLVAGLVVFAASMAGSMWAITSNVRDINTRLEMSAEIDKANARLQDERTTAIRDAVASMQRRQELQQYEIQGLKEAIGRLMKGTP